MQDGAERLLLAGASSFNGKCGQSSATATLQNGTVTLNAGSTGPVVAVGELPVTNEKVTSARWC